MWDFQRARFGIRVLPDAREQVCEAARDAALFPRLPHPVYRVSGLPRGMNRLDVEGTLRTVGWDARALRRMAGKVRDGWVVEAQLPPATLWFSVPGGVATVQAERPRKEAAQQQAEAVRKPGPSAWRTGAWGLPAPPSATSMTDDEAPAPPLSAADRLRTLAEQAVRESSQVRAQNAADAMRAEADRAAGAALAQRSAEVGAREAAVRAAQSQQHLATPAAGGGSDEVVAQLISMRDTFAAERLQLKTAYAEQAVRLQQTQDALQASDVARKAAEADVQRRIAEAVTQMRSEFAAGQISSPPAQEGARDEMLLATGDLQGQVLEVNKTVASMHKILAKLAADQASATDAAVAAGRAAAISHLASQATASQAAASSSSPRSKSVHGGRDDHSGRHRSRSRDDSRR